MTEIDELLKGISMSLDQTKAAIEGTKTKYIDEAETLLPPMIQQILKKEGNELEEMSLLSLKSNSLLSYVNNLALIVLAHLSRLQEDVTQENRKAAVQACIEQRITLEKGIKPLEKKLLYQLDKIVRSFHRMEEESAKLEQKLNEQSETGEIKNNSEGYSDSDFDSSDSEDKEDALFFRPDAAALAKMAPSKRKHAKASALEEESKEKYKPPKISAVAPPSVKFDDRAGPKQHSRKLQSMEEYLAETSDLPQMESSIGSTIVDKGRGGVKTSREKQKEKEIQRYEEGNFTRLPSTATKKSFKQKMSERVNNFAGEDWSMFSSKRELKDGTSRKRKAASTWDRAKKRQS